MSSHEERAQDWLHDHGVSDMCDDRDPAASLAAEFAAVEAEAQKRVAVLEAALKGVLRGNPTTSDWDTAEAALSGEPTVVLKLLERAVEAGINDVDKNGETHEEPADIAKRVWEGE